MVKTHKPKQLTFEDVVVGALTSDGFERRAWARISPCGLYRYELGRIWNVGEADRIVAFVMLNPSTADAEKNDPTIRRCIGLAQSWGYDGLRVVNLFAYRSTDPCALVRVDDPVGPDNDRIMLSTTEACSAVVAAWGARGSLYPERVRAVLSLLGSPLSCCGFTRSGSPRHPLYLPSDTKLESWDWATSAGSHERPA